MLKNALALAARGWRVLPLYEIGPDGRCTCGKECKSPGKHPRTQKGVLHASSEERAIEHWWTEWPTANIGIATGIASDLLILDVDTLEAHGVDGVGSWANLLATNGPIPMTYAVQTGSGGRQIYFRYPQGSGITIGASVLAKGIDHRGEGGYVVAPPSNHASGGVYETILDASPAEAPAWVIAGLTRPKDVPAPSSAPERQATPAELALARRKLGERCSAIESIPKKSGKGHESLVRESFLVGGLWPLSVKERESAIMAAAERRYPNLSPDTLRQVRGCLAKGAAHPINLAGEIEDAELFQTPTKKGEAPKSSGTLEWIGSGGMFAELPDTQWLVPGLQLCPGRPTMVAGYGFSGKTMSCQALLLAYASGRAVWNKFPSHPGGVARHFDHEQGKHATLKRYQRLARGYGIAPAELERLAVACFPPIRLTHKDAVEAYTRECTGVDLVLIDSLRAVVPDIDENDSAIRKYIDILSEVSDKTGAAFVLIHHAGKGEGDHAGVRGSSAIFDGCGCVLELRATEDGIKVTQSKGPAESDEGRIAPFGLEISDVQVDNDPRAGVRVVHVDAPEPKRASEDRREKIVAHLAKYPGTCPTTLATDLKLGKGTVNDTLQSLEAAGVLVRKGTQQAQEWYLASNS